MTKDRRAFILRTALCATLAAIMTGAAKILGEKEIIFPEIAALAVGAVAAPKQSWQVSKFRMVLLIAVCSVAGILTVRFSPLPKAENIVVAYLVCQALLMLSRTSFAPLISAAVLPILMDTETIIYPISAVSMTVLTIAARSILERLGYCEKAEFAPLPPPAGSKILSALVRTAVIQAAIFPLLHFGYRFCIAPPLLVAFTEFSQPESKARLHPIRAVAVIAACALAGAALRYLLCILAGMPITAAAVLSVLFALALMKLSGMYIPPAGALGMLPMIIPQESLPTYPLQILVGASVLMCMAMTIGRIYGRSGEKQDVNS